MTVIVMVDHSDPTPERLVAELRRRGAAVARLDPAWFPEELTAAAELTGGSWTGTLAGHDPDLCVIDTDGRTALTDVTGVFYRRPRGFTLDVGLVTEGPERHTAAQARLGIAGLLYTVGPWTNHPHRSSYAEYLPVQLRTAHDVGLRVPRTCVTNDPASAHRFVSGLGRAIRKPFRGHEIGGEYPGPSVPTLVSPADCDERVSTTAHLFQEWIEPAYTVRLTVVDDRMFAAREEAWVDRDTEYLPIAVTPPVRHATTELLNRFGLRFAALDFVVDAGERWWFVGCDPNPGWAAVEDRAGFPITAALADALHVPSGAPEPVSAPVPALLSAPGPLPAR